jgi:hypothetical protein
MMKFKTWVEERNSEQSGIQSGLLEFLKSKTGIDDDEQLLSMNTSEFTPELISDLQQWGPVNTAADPEILDRIKNGIEIKELADALSGIHGI